MSLTREGQLHLGNRIGKHLTKPFEVGRKIVVPYLKGRGITTIDKLISDTCRCGSCGRCR